MEYSFWLSRTRVLSRRPASLCTPISRAWRCQNACLAPYVVVFSFPIASSLMFINGISFHFHTSACCWIWVLHLFISLCVSSVSCQFVSFDHFFLGVGIFFWLTFRSSFVFQILIPCLLQTLQISSLILLIVY